MGRSPFARKHTLWLSSLATLVGIVFTVLAFAANYEAAGWTDFYEAWVPQGTGAGNWNRFVQVVAPIVLVTGGWYLGEQIIARRKFNRMISTESKSEFQRNLDELEQTAGKLPKRFKEQLEDKREEFVSRRKEP